MADGSSKGVQTSMTGEIKVNGRRTTIRAIVLETLSYDIILGMDALEAIGAKIIWTPTHHQTCTMGLSPLQNQEKQALEKLIKEEREKSREIKGPTHLVEYKIKLLDPTPIKQRYRPRNPAIQEIINQHVNEMLEQGVIEPSSSPWSSPIVLAKKKDNSYRFCIDYRRLNEVTEKDAYPLPQINATLDKLKGAKYLSTIDLKSGYWQVPLARESKPLTAFTVPGRGLMQFKVLPFGLHSAPAVFQRLVDRVVTPALEEKVFCYLDDIVIISKTFTEHLEMVKEILRRLREAKLSPNWQKCQFGRRELTYLGHQVTEHGIGTDPGKIEAILALTPPNNVKELRRFNGIVSWYRRFVPNVATMTAPMNELLQKGRKWQWTIEHQQAFDNIRRSLAEAPVLACPDHTKEFCLQTDASNTGLGAVLTQEHDGQERIIAYASRSLNKAERNYSATEKECLAVKWGIWKMRDYLEGYRFTVITDHQALQWLSRIDNPSGRLARWAIELAQWDYKIRYRKGSENILADALSRHNHEVSCIGTKCTWYTEKLQEAANNKDPDYKTVDGKLFKKTLTSLNFATSDGREHWKLCVPTEERRKVLQETHDAPTAGHLGIAKTFFRLTQQYYWPRMRKDVIQYVQSCHQCQAVKALQQPPAGQMLATEVGEPWETVSADLIGPQPTSHRQNVWLLVMQDRLTKWIEVAALRKATGENITRKIKEAIVLRHGCPRTIITDNGKQFVSKHFKNFLKNSKIIHRRTPPYTPQCNPVERTNRVIKTMISQYVKQDHKNWDKFLCEICFAYNTAKSDSTGFTPAFLNHGRELTHPGALHMEGNNPSARTTRRKQLSELEEAITLARQNLAQSFQRQSRQYDKGRRNWRPNIGEKVMAKSHLLSDKGKNINAKLAPKYEGPYLVIGAPSPVIFQLKEEGTNKTRRAHIGDLKKYYTSTEPPITEEPTARRPRGRPPKNRRRSREKG